jgi:hypothetical protein
MLAMPFTVISSMWTELIPCFSLTSIMESRLITCLVSSVHLGIWRLCTHCSLSFSAGRSRTVGVQGTCLPLGHPAFFHCFLTSSRPLVMVEKKLTRFKGSYYIPLLRTMPGTVEILKKGLWNE